MVDVVESHRVNCHKVELDVGDDDIEESDRLGNRPLGVVSSKELRLYNSVEIISDDIIEDDLLEDNTLELDKNIIIPTVIDKYMFIKKGGKAIHQLGDISRFEYDAELIYVHGETDTDWIGQYCEGFGFVNVKFAKEDCRDATDEEVKLCTQGLMKTIKF